MEIPRSSRNQPGGQLGPDLNNLSTANSRRDFLGKLNCSSRVLLEIMVSRWLQQDSQRTPRTLRGGFANNRKILQLAPRSRPVGQRIGTWNPLDSQGIPMGTKGRQAVLHEGRVTIDSLEPRHVIWRGAPSWNLRARWRARWRQDCAGPQRNTSAMCPRLLSSASEGAFFPCAELGLYAKVGNGWRVRLPSVRM
eukprot:gene13703-biopygen1874